MTVLFNTSSPAKGTKSTLCLADIRNKVELVPLVCKEQSRLNALGLHKCIKLTCTNVSILIQRVLFFFFFFFFFFFSFFFLCRTNTV